MSNQKVEINMTERTEEHLATVLARLIQICKATDDELVKKEFTDLALDVGLYRALLRNHDIDKRIERMDSVVYKKAYNDCSFYIHREQFLDEVQEKYGSIL